MHWATSTFCFPDVGHERLYTTTDARAESVVPADCVVIRLIREAEIQDLLPFGCDESADAAHHKLALLRSNDRLRSLRSPIRSAFGLLSSALRK